MEVQERTCAQCKAVFKIEPEDFSFYERIKVFPPTWCSECRLQRRLATRNERTLYRRNCDLCQKAMITRYSKEVEFPVYCVPCWYSDKWDPMEYGREYDFSKNFFVQLAELHKVVPHPALYMKNAVSSEYSNQVLDVKNAYLSFAILRSEDIYYSFFIDHSRNIFDSLHIDQSEQCYELVNTANNNRALWSTYAHNSIDIGFCYDVRNSSNCFGCVNLRNAKHQIWNTQYSPEEYEKERAKWDLGSYTALTKAKEKFYEFSLRFPRRYSMLFQTVHSTGNDLQNTKNAINCFNSREVEDSKNIYYSYGGLKNSQDINYSVDAELSYDSWSAIGSRVKFSIGAWGEEEIYTEFCSSTGSHDLFGCVSVTAKKEYVVLNKQYTKSEYENLLPKILKHMSDMPYVDSLGRIYIFGEFFPPDFSHHAYNETIAQEFFPLTKEEVIKKGYRWKEPEARTYAITIKPVDLPDHIKEVTDVVLQEVIGCMHEGKCNEQCVTAFKITAEELQFYRRMNLALPRLCPNCRHYERLERRNPLKLWHRQCMCDYKVYVNTAKHPHHEIGKCPNEFETSYAPDRKEIIYCEACYNAEVV